MTEEQKPTDEAAAEEAASSEIMAEFQALGQELVTTVKSLWESDESRKLRQEIGDGFAELGRQVDAAVQSAQESETAKQFSEQVKETMDKARESQVTKQVEEGLVTGLKMLNEQLSKLVTSLETPEPAGQESEAEAETEV